MDDKLTSPILMNKITPSNKWMYCLKRLTNSHLKPTNKNLKQVGICLKFFSQKKGKSIIKKTFGSSVIYSPMSLSSLTKSRFIIKVCFKFVCIYIFRLITKYQGYILLIQEFT